MVATALINPGDKEDLALALNGKKKKIKYSDFVAAYTSLKLAPKQQENIFKKMERAKYKWIDFINISFLSDDLKDAYIALIEERFARLNGR